MENEFVKGFKEGFKLFGECIGIIINSILLTIVYFVGFGLTSIIGKLFGKEFLETKIDENAKTYWTDLNLDKKPMEEYYRQF